MRAAVYGGSQLEATAIYGMLRSVGVPVAVRVVNLCAFAVQAELRRDGVTVLDRFGQRRQHPASVCECDARSVLLMALKALGLDPRGVA